jgi:L-fuconolactonase
VIDAHAHLWRIGANGCTWPTPELAPIHRDFELADLRRASPADGVILVQSQEDAADTAWLLSLADDPMVAGVVGWAESGAIPHHPKLVGLRPMVQDREADWYDRFDASEMGARKLVLDALVRPPHLPALERLALAHPDLPIVIDHAAKPDIADLSGWNADIRALAACPNVACKLSGLLTEMEASQIAPVFAVLWESFGPDRLVWGSDWPVLTLAASYAEWLALARALVPAEHHTSVFDANARRIYQLKEAA